MSKPGLELKPRPKFATDPKGKPKTVTLDTVAYVTLLVKANITDPSLRPPGMQEGATALARVRKIEADCIAKHGKFDWEKLPEKIKDEYDSLCSLLNDLQDTGERIRWEDYKAKRAYRDA